MTLTFGFAARMALSIVVYESMMAWTSCLPMLTSLVPSMNWTMSGLVFWTQPTMLFLAMSYACQPEWPSWWGSKPAGFEHFAWRPLMLPTNWTLLASPADVIWFHTRGRQQVISVMESPSSTFFGQVQPCQLQVRDRQVQRGVWRRLLTDFDFLRAYGGGEAGKNRKSQDLHGDEDLKIGL